MRPDQKGVCEVTVLAFIYVPLNLAASIFGMDLQQLSQSGQKLAAFLITAAIALFVTGFSWFCVEQVNSYLTWRRRKGETSSRKNTNYSIAIRVAMQVALVYRGYSSWLRASMAWRRILTNDP